MPDTVTCPLPDKKRYATADTQDVLRLQLQSDNAFRDTVATEAQGKGELPDRLALRHPGILLRWNRALKDLRADLNKQLTNRAGDKTLTAHDWRKRAFAYRDSLTLRINECRDLRAATHQAAAQRHAGQSTSRDDQMRFEEQAAAAKAARREARDALLDQQLDRCNVPRLRQKELRRIAGENAIQLLIDAHGIEFSRYLAEECDRLGAELPGRVRKYLTDTPPQPLPNTA
jgi:hypothetical protein